MASNNEQEGTGGRVRGRSEPITINNSRTLPEANLSAGDAQLRKWCIGQPPKVSYLGSDGHSPPRFRLSRRSTLADKPELDHQLKTTMVDYNGHKYLPLTSTTIHRLSPYWKGAKPIADVKIFERIMINQEVNAVHADHVVAAMERIGGHCKHLLVVAPIRTSELGNVFNRETDNVSPGNDWERILACFPNLQWLMFIHPLSVPTGFFEDTFLALRTAVTKRQATQTLKNFDFSGPPGMLANFPYNAVNNTADTTNATGTTN